MQRKRVDGYAPNYPKKWIRGAALTAAAVMALGTGTGCKAIFPVQTDGIVPYSDPTEEPIPEGYVEIADPDTEQDEPALQGKIVVPEEQNP